MHCSDAPRGHAKTVLSRVGLGAWAFGGVGWGRQDDRDSIAAIHRASELGVNWIDTAAVYGGGHAEMVVGEALAALPQAERPRVFTKCGVRVDANTGRTYRDLRPASLRAECHESLKRLRMDRIDLLQLHWPVEDRSLVEDAWTTLDELQEEGKVRRIGVTNFDDSTLDLCASIRRVDSVQIPLSMLDRRCCEHVLPWATSHGVQLLAYSPLESGLLSGGFSKERLATLPPDDWRQRRPPFQSPRVDRALNLVDCLRPIADEAGITLVELAIAWTLSWPSVTGAIVGARRADQVDSWMGAQTVSLDAAILERIRAATAQTKAGQGPLAAPGVLSDRPPAAADRALG
jgi:aryl-alcohol dehydrogenase-like predicted oxidoreductase